MIKCIVGLKGSGKTKQLIQMVNETVQNEHGSVICIEKSQKLIDTVDYAITGFEGFYGFICGLFAQNYDISTIFVDSLFKITGSEDPAATKQFFEKLDAFSKKTTISFISRISAELDALPEIVKLYL